MGVVQKVVIFFILSASVGKERDILSAVLGLLCNLDEDDSAINVQKSRLD